MNQLILESAYAVGWALLHSLWLGTLVGLVALLVSGLVRDAAARHLVNLCGLVAIGLVLLICLTGERPVGPVGDAVFPEDSLPDIETVEVSPQQDKSGVTYSEEAAIRSPEPELPLSSVAKVSGEASAETVRFSNQWISWLALVWITGVGFLSLRHFLGCLRIRSLRRSGRRSPSAELEEMVSELRVNLQISDRVSVFISEQVVSPILTGILKPIVLLPISVVNGLSQEEVSALLAHELAHLRRRDHWANAFQIVLETILFYHPLVWLLGRQIRRDRELAADDCALHCGADRRDLARALAAVAVRPMPHSALAASDGPLLYRIRRLTRATPDPSSGQPGMASVTCVCALIAGTVLFTALLPSVFAQSEKPVTVTVPPGESIQTVIDGAKPGTIIQLAEGLYPGRIKITKALTIRGVSWEKTSILPPPEKRRKIRLHRRDSRHEGSRSRRRPGFTRRKPRKRWR